MFISNIWKMCQTAKLSNENCPAPQCKPLGAHRKPHFCLAALGWWNKKKEPEEKYFHAVCGERWNFTLINLYPTAVQQGRTGPVPATCNAVSNSGIGTEVTGDNCLDIGHWLLVQLVWTHLKSISSQHPLDQIMLAN